ncbi:MAG: hypothetical protein HYS41_00010 [Candidatus Omnitrophica bacterium]|nr:hypothetical protein [Candidatus Omnitrophota bacterium]
MRLPDKSFWAGLLFLTLLLTAYAFAEQIEFSTFYPTSPGGGGGGGGGRGPDAAFGTNFQAQAPPANGMIVEGNIGIGTASPNRALEVGSGLSSAIADTVSILGLNSIGAGNADGGAVLLDAGNGTTYGAVQAWRYDTNAPIPLILQNQGGDVGIGTTNPALAMGDGSSPRILAVDGGAGTGTYGLLRLMSGNTAEGIAYGAISFGSSGFTSAEKRLAQIAAINEDSGDAPYGTLQFWTTDDGVIGERMRITYKGNVGIGTANPQSRLHLKGVSGNSYMTMEYSTIAKSRFGNQANGPFISSDTPGKAIEFYTTPTGGSSTRQMFINANGNVGIGGTTMPLVGLMAEKNNGSGYAGWFRASAASSGVGLGTAIGTTAGKIQGLSSGGVAADLAVNPHGGNVGVGMDTPSATLEVNGTMKVLGAWESKNPNTTYTAPSDGFVVFSNGGNGAGDDGSLGQTPVGSTRTRAYGYNGSMFPVRKGDKWRVTHDANGGGGNCYVDWIPLGQ